MDPVAIRAQGVTKRFGGLTALDDVTLSVSRGDILGLIGPNGAGKSTLFNICAGAAVADRGELEWFGARVRRPTPRKASSSGIARTFQLVELFSSMTVAENVALGALARERSLKAAMRHADAVLERTGLGQYAGLLPGELSFGRRRRVELARALAARPSVLLADEVMAGVAPHEIHEVSDILADLSVQGVGIVVVEHNLEFVMNFCRSIVVLDRGKIIATGTPDQVANDERVIEKYIGKGGRGRPR